MELIKYIFSSFWIFLGFSLLFFGSLEFLIRLIHGCKGPEELDDDSDMLL